MEPLDVLLILVAFILLLTASLALFAYYAIVKGGKKLYKRIRNELEYL